MAISDAEFTAWLAKDAPRVVLAELKYAYESGGAPAEGTIYLANRPFVTRPEDTPASQPYRDVIRGVPKFSRSVPTDPLGGITAVAVGELDLDNADGSVDFLLDLIIDGRECRLYLGSPEWPRSDFRLVLVTLAEVASAADDATLRVLLRDQRLLLDKAIAGAIVNDERRKPIVLTYGGGAGYSIEPVEKSAATLEYYVLDNYAGGTVQDVKDNGLSLSSGLLWTGDNTAITANAGTDTITRVAHGLAVNDVIDFTTTGSIFAGLTGSTQYWVISAGLTADDFRLSTSKGGSAVDITGTSFSGLLGCTRKRYFNKAATDGTIQLSSTPAGRLTADVVGYSISQDLGTGAVGELLRAMLIDYGGMLAADVDTTSFRAADSTMTGNWLLTGRAVLQRENLLEVLDDIARVAQICYGPDHAGTFRAFRLDLSSLSGQTATREVTALDVMEAPGLENERIVTGTVALLSRKNERALSYGEFAGAVTVADRRELAGQFRMASENTAPTGSGYSTNWQGFHRTASRREVGGAIAASGASLTALADEILGDLKPHRKTVSLEIDLRAYEWRLGDVVRLTYPRYGLSAGVNFRLVGIETDLISERCSLRLLTRIAPDTSTASHN